MSKKSRIKARRNPPLVAALNVNRLQAPWIASNGQEYPMVRMAHPSLKNHYYRTPQTPEDPPWVLFGYATWTIAEWKAKFLQDIENDLRCWDFFGETIDIWEGYQPE